MVEQQSSAEPAGVEAARVRAAQDGQTASARDRLDYATLKLKRLTEMQRENFVSAQSRAEADAERRLAEPELAAATESRELARIELRLAINVLAQRTMLAPFNGVVLDCMRNPGDLAEAGSGRKPVLKVAQIDPLNVHLGLPAPLPAAVQPGSRARVVPQRAQQALLATVAMVGRVIDAASDTFVARLELSNPNSAILGGVRCTTAIAGVAVPAAPAGAGAKPVP